MIYNSQQDQSLYILTNDLFLNWTFVISAENSFGDIAEYEAVLNIIQCSSKTCSQWSGPYQSDCKQWVAGYVPQSDGTWLWQSLDLFTTHLMFYSTWGLIVWVIIILQLVLAVKIKHLSLHPLFYSQKILLLMLSLSTFDQDLATFAAYFEWTKLDLGFLYFGIQNKYGYWAYNEKLAKAGFYWDTAIQNYLFLILMSLI